MTEVPWDVQTLNQRRLERLQEDPFTRYSDHGVIAIDNTLIDRDGQLIPDAGWFWDHAEERNKIAQDYLFINYVCTSGKHYPLEFRLFRKQEICEALKQPFRNHTVLCCRAIDRLILGILGKGSVELVVRSHLGIPHGAAVWRRLLREVCLPFLRPYPILAAVMDGDIPSRPSSL